MAEQQVQEWTLDGVLDELSKIDVSMPDRQFAFILGAGASFTSGIPTGKDLAQRWLKDMHLRECADGSDVDTWIQGWSGIKDLSLASAADHYPEIFERRFLGDREAGYAELETAMEGKSPSLGYSLLAEIIQHTRHKVVITTNFDNLVADALAMHAHQSPLVVAHESLTGFVRPQLRRPLVAKIHRDLFLHPKNDLAGVATMEEGWKLALKKLFQYFTPIVVGYGGNDGSLMDMLLGLDAGDIAGRLVWCYREGSPPPVKAKQVMLKHQGLQVKIAGFDEFMLELAAKLMPTFDLGVTAERTEKLGKERAERYREQAARLRESSARGSVAQRRAGVVLSKSIQPGKSWWAWQMLADSEPESEKRDLIYKQGLREFSDSAELTGNYAVFLADERKDYDTAEAMYKKALELDPRNANITCNYANFLKNQRKDYDSAEALYKKALELDPSNANITGNYATFLKNQRKDYEAAEALFKKALELDPRHANFTGNYANFLAVERKDYDAAEAMYKKALELDPSDATITGNYALFQADERKDYDAAEALFKKALELDPSNANFTGNYALFLKNQRKDYEAAEALFKKALELDPSNANFTGNYANFLAVERKDYDAAEAMYKKALELDPSDATITGNYALFQADERKDYDAAEALFKKALELDPSDAKITGNYALFQADERKDYDAAEALFKKALELDPSNANFTGNYANFLKNQRKDYDAAEALFKKALELDPSHVNNTGNYATFLAVGRKDYDAAEALYKKALELDSSHANITSNYALFLAVERKDYDAAEATYKKALELNSRNPNDFANLASLKSSRGDVQSLEAVPSLVRQVVTLCERKAAQTTAEALLYGALQHELAPGGPDEGMLARLKGLLAMGYERGSWDFDPMFAVTLPKLPQERQGLYRSLGAAILDQSKVIQLEAIADWQSLEPMDPFAPFASP